MVRNTSLSERSGSLRSAWTTPDGSVDLAEGRLSLGEIGCQFLRGNMGVDASTRAGGTSSRRLCDDLRQPLRAGHASPSKITISRFLGRHERHERPGVDVGAEHRAAIELVVADRYMLRLWPSVRATRLREVLAALEDAR